MRRTALWVHPLGESGGSRLLRAEVVPSEPIRFHHDSGSRANDFVGASNLQFWPETWDGSDLFSPEGSRLVIVTQAVCDALVKAKVTNARMKRITEVEMLTGPWETGQAAEATPDGA